MQGKHAEEQATGRVTREENTAYPDTEHAPVAAPATPFVKSYDAFTWIALLGGLWIAISPWVMNFSVAASRMEINNVIIGLAAALIAIVSMTAMRGISGSGAANLVLGAWIIATAFFLFSGPVGVGPFVSQIIGGAVILVFAAAGQFGARLGVGRR